MSDETTTSSEVKTTSDGTVKIAVERYEELLQKANRPQTVNVTRTQVIKTPEMAAREYRTWGATFMTLGASMFFVGVLLYRNGRV